MRITWFGHSAFRLDFADRVVLIDPFLAGNPAFAGGDRGRAAAGATHILVTHGHARHLGDALAIAAETGARIAASPELCAWLAGRGATNLDPASTGDSIDLGGFAAAFVHAEHAEHAEHAAATGGTSGESAASAAVPPGPANGVVVRAPGEPVVYHLGDTHAFDGMAGIAGTHAPEVALVPIGGGSTMGAADAATAMRSLVRPRVAIPCHYGGFARLAPDADAFVAAMAGSGVDVVVPHRSTAVTIDAAPGRRVNA